MFQGVFENRIGHVLMRAGKIIIVDCGEAELQRW